MGEVAHRVRWSTDVYNNDHKFMKIEKDIKVVMRDGVRISLCVYRP